MMCYCVLQNELSVQFDDLFRKAWEEDIITEHEGDGMQYLCVCLFHEHLLSPIIL